MADVEIIKAKETAIVHRRGKRVEQLRVAAYCRVSTDGDEQIESYNSQVRYYTDLIQSKREWILVDIYADEAITGTMVDRRDNFIRMINDCMSGSIDMIITKSISRFARNTLDVLKYVRMLKDKNIAIQFEEENINTLTMDGELLLSILSAVYQQEVENTSANVKKGLKMKMQRGELVGFQGCMGYDYNADTKTITVNEEEAKVVQYIFKRYLEGAGGSMIGKELENLEIRTKRGHTKWTSSAILGIIKNEKYKGDILMGKTFKVSPITKRRLPNFGEEDKFYIREHHEPIISAEIFAKAQEIRHERNVGRNKGPFPEGVRLRVSHRFTFSCMIECGFCGGTLTRRSWHSGSEYHKTIWQCVVSTKKGKKFCPDSKGITEEAIEKAFVESYRLTCGNNKDILDEFIERAKDSLNDDTFDKEYEKAQKDVKAIELKINKLVDLRLEGGIDKAIYDEKYEKLLNQLETKKDYRDKMAVAVSKKKDTEKRLMKFKQVLEQNRVLDEFDPNVFESIIEKVIVGGIDEDGNKDPAQLTFVYKTGFSNQLDGRNFKPERKNVKDKKTDTNCKEQGVKSLSSDSGSSSIIYVDDKSLVKLEEGELCSFSHNDEKQMCSLSRDITCGVCSVDRAEIVLSHKVCRFTNNFNMWFMFP